MPTDDVQLELGPNVGSNMRSFGAFVRLIAIIGIVGALAILAGCANTTTPTKSVSSVTPTIVSDPDWAFAGFRVYFDSDSTEINATGQAEIDSALREVPQASNWAVTGHADRAGTERYNMKLSLRRANAVRAALIARGVSPDLITVAGRGESEPDVPTADGAREQANRLVRIIPQ